MPENQIISLQKVTISQETTILTDVQLEVFGGDFIYLIGKTGAGKSSLLRTLYADLPLGGGEAFVCGFALHALKKKQVSELRRNIGIVFQDFQLLTDRNVYKNLAFVLQATGHKDKLQIEEKVMAALESVELSNKALTMPHRLSEGEMQRVSIARALINNPKLILADEPTGNLDPIISEGIITLLKSICKEKNTAVLMATHDYIIIEKHPSRVICCDGGKLVV